MFGKLKDKLKTWTKSLSKKAESEEIEEKVPKEEIEKTPKEKTKKGSKKDEKKSKGKKPKKQPKEEIIEKGIEEPEEVSELIEEDEEIIETPKKFNAGTQSYEPDLEKINEIKENLPEPEETSKNEKQKKSFFGKFSSKVKFSEEDFEEYSEDLEMLLIENNVALEVAEKIVEEIKEKLVGKEISKKEIEFEIQNAFKEVIEKILIEPFDIIEEIKKFKENNPKKPYVILFCGINGTGKTTSIAKISYLLQKNKFSSVLAAGDTFRAASIEQLKKHGEKLQIKVIAHEYGSDPASVGFDAIKYAEKNEIDVVLIDTAGRMHTEKNLMKEMEKIANVTKPNTKIFVGESTTGNDIVEQVKAFNSSISIDGIILSKADIDEKGGTALSVGVTTGKPILYLGTGQNYNDFEPFDKEKFIEKLGLN
jgi:fused signal recognition particle receptor